MKRYLLLALVILAPGIAMTITTEPDYCAGPVVSLTFDDGYEETATVAAPLLNRYGVAGTAYVIPGRVGGTFEERALMGWDDLHELERAGWEIGGQTLTHANLSALNRSEIAAEFGGAKQVLQEHGFSPVTTSIPYGHYPASAEPLAMDHYTAVRTSSWGHNPLPGFDPAHIRAVWVTNTTTWNELQAVVDSGTTEAQWTVVMFHQVTDSTADYRYASDPVLLQQLLSALEQDEVPVRTVKDVVGRCG